MTTPYAAWSVTGVGSLPHVDASEAAAFVRATAPTLPYLAQLPNRDPAEGMLTQWGVGVAGARQDGLILRPGGRVQRAFAPQATGGYEACLDALAGWDGPVKVPVTGPVTVAVALLAGGGERPDLHAVGAELGARAALLLGRVREALPAAVPVVTVDEPGLAALAHPGFPYRPADVAAALRAIVAGLPHAGVHCCAEVPWPVVLAAKPAYVSFDVGTLGAATAGLLDAVCSFVNTGGSLWWGAVPTDTWPVPAVDDLYDRLTQWEGELALAGADPARLATQAVLTPACGLAGLSEAHAADVMERCAELARRMGG